MHHLVMEICYDKCVLRRFQRSANATECSYIHLGGAAFHRPRAHGTACASRLQTCSARARTEYCRQLQHSGTYLCVSTYLNAERGLYRHMKHKHGAPVLGTFHEQSPRDWQLPWVRW